MSNKVCPCIGELLATMVAIEALEHNSTQSKLWMELGEELKKKAPELFADFSLEYPQLESTIREPLAEWASDAWLLKIQEQCQIKTEDLRIILTDGLKEMDAGRPSQAYFRYVDAKMKILSRATEVCKEAH